jgi:hypothetical protein
LENGRTELTFHGIAKWFQQVNQKRPGHLTSLQWREFRNKGISLEQRQMILALLKSYRFSEVRGRLQRRIRDVDKIFELDDADLQKYLQLLFPLSPAILASVTNVIHSGFETGFRNWIRVINLESPSMWSKFYVMLRNLLLENGEISTGTEELVPYFDRPENVALSKGLLKSVKSILQSQNLDNYAQANAESLMKTIRVLEKDGTLFGTNVAEYMDILISNRIELNSQVIANNAYYVTANDIALRRVSRSGDMKPASVTSSNREKRKLERPDSTSRGRNDQPMKKQARPGSQRAPTPAPIRDKSSFVKCFSCGRMHQDGTTAEHLRKPAQFSEQLGKCHFVRLKHKDINKEPVAFVDSTIGKAYRDLDPGMDGESLNWKRCLTDAKTAFKTYNKPTEVGDLTLTQLI